MAVRIAVTGSEGFVGRAVLRALQARGLGAEVVRVDRAFADDPGPGALALDLAEPGAAARVAEAADCVIHLAALPGGAAEADPAASRRVNLDATLDLIAAMAGRRLILASSVAALGSSFGALVDDSHVPRPTSTYATHKRMAELAFADAVRRGDLAGLALRLPGIVARPPAAAGFGSAFLSDVVHAIRAGQPYTLPVGPEGVTWLLSARRCAANLVDAALHNASVAEAINSPALTVRIADWVAALAAYGDAGGITYAPDPAVERVFASYPPLLTPQAEALGLAHDGDVAALAAAVLADG